MIKMQDLTPKRMVAIFDRYVHGQQDAKAILAVAIRNRWRLCRLDHDARLAVVKQNILLHGPTGSGKTALLRVLKNHFGLPVSEVDITEYTETGYVGKEVGQIIKDLFSLEIVVPDWYKEEWLERQQRDAQAASKAKEEEQAAAPAPVVDKDEALSIMEAYCVKMLYACARLVKYGEMEVGNGERKALDGYIYDLFTSEKIHEEEWPKLHEARRKISKVGGNAVCNLGLGHMLKADLTRGRPAYGKESKYSMMPSFEVSDKLPSWDETFNGIRKALRDENVTRAMGIRLIRSTAAEHCKVYQMTSASRALMPNPHVFNPLGDDLFQSIMQRMNRNAAPMDEWKKRFIQDYGVVFVDEIDKLAESGGDGGKDRVSRTGVQRSLLKALEGEDGHEYNTLNILWIGAGSFANQPISKLMPELQGRLPLRARIAPLDKTAYVSILKLPSSVFHSSCALLQVDGVKVHHDEHTLEVVAEACDIVNQGTSNLGARRLGDLVNELFMPAFYEPDTYVVDGYDIRGEKAKWLLETARTTVKQYQDSLAAFVVTEK